MLPACFPQLPTPLPYKSWRLRAGLEVEESHRPGDSVEELSGGTGRQWRGAVGGAVGSVAELSGTEAVRGDLTTELHLH